jgi:glyoxylase-like metal-dependent hydrolase (beta-lactamase superfamily II)
VRIADLVIHAIESQPFSENTYVFNRAGQTDCVIVDPGFEPNKIVEYIDAEKLVPTVILNTHGHSDHIAGNEAMKRQWPDIPLVIGEEEAEKLTDPQLNLSAPFGANLISPPADQTVKEGDSIQFAGIELDVFDTPGHSRGHVVFIYRSTPTVVFAGDVLFSGSVGRTDFPDGSFEDLAHSIHHKLFVLPGDSIVLPGHGPATTIDQEITGNPFVGAPAGYSR